MNIAIVVCIANQTCYGSYCAVQRVECQELTLNTLVVLLYIIVCPIICFDTELQITLILK